MSDEKPEEDLYDAVAAYRVQHPEPKLHHDTGLWWPGDVVVKPAYAHMIKRVTDVDCAVRHCRKTAVAVQAGGNVGMWPLRLAKYFSTVHTFEPVTHIYECLLRNTGRVPGIVQYDALLSDKVGAPMPFSVRTGATSRVVGPSEANVFLRSLTIDSLELPACDLIYLDIEGHELEALSGAVVTIAQFRPVIVVESWGKNQQRYAKWLDGLGYDEVERVHTDGIYVPRKK